jgi:hypothetical protein
MTRFSKPIVFSVLLVAGILIATGCGKSRPQELTLTDSAVTGSWLESAPTTTASPRRAQTSEPKFLRHVTLNADKTFIFSLRTLDGAVTSDDKKVEGTWEIDSEQNAVALTVTKNPFKSSETGYDWVPETLSEMTQKEIAGEGKTDIIYATDLAGRSAKLVRQS